MQVPIHISVSAGRVQQHFFRAYLRLMGHLYHADKTDAVDALLLALRVPVKSPSSPTASINFGKTRCSPFPATEHATMNSVCLSGV